MQSDPVALFLFFYGLLQDIECSSIIFELSHVHCFSVFFFFFTAAHAACGSSWVAAVAYPTVTATPDLTCVPACRILNPLGDAGSQTRVLMEFLTP